MLCGVFSGLVQWWNQLLVGGWLICGMDKEEVVEEEVSLDFTHQGGVQLINALWFPFFNKEVSGCG